MFTRALVYVLFTCVVHGQPSAPASAGSIRGTIRDSGTGISLAESQVQLVAGGKATISVLADSQGRYEFRGVDPGTVTVRVFPPGNIPGNPPVNRTVFLSDKQDLTGVDIRLRAQGEITGRITNEDGDPLAGIVVWLVAREYSLGELKYILTFRGRTNEAGEYTIRGVTPGRPYLVLAAPFQQITRPVSGVAADPQRRKPVVAPTYYPGTERAEGGLGVAIRPAEKREHVDIRMTTTASFCAEGVVPPDVPGEPMWFELTAGSEGPVQGAIRTVSSVANFSLLPLDVQMGPDGRFRICELPPGNYRLSVHSDVPKEKGRPTAIPRVNGSTEFTIVDRDLNEITVSAMPQIRVPGQVEWADDLKGLDGVQVTVRLLPLGRMARPQEVLTATVTASGIFFFDRLLMGEYAIRVEGLPRSTYVKDVLYAGRSVLASPLRVGDTIGSGDLRVVLGRNGGYVNVRVLDRENNAIPDTVVIFPAGVTLTSALAEAMAGGATGQSGSWVSPPLPPGKYVVLTTPSIVDFSPESLARVWNARASGREVEISPQGTVDLTLPPALFE